MNSGHALVLISFKLFDVKMIIKMHSIDLSHKSQRAAFSSRHSSNEPIEDFLMGVTAHETRF